MAIPLNFRGANKHFVATPDQAETGVGDLHAFSNGSLNVTMWRPTDKEMEEIIRTGVIALSIHSGEHFFPALVGSESVVRASSLDFGKTWPRLKIIA